MHDRLVTPRITADAFDHHGLTTSSPEGSEAKRTDADLEPPTSILCILARRVLYAWNMIDLIVRSLQRPMRTR